MNMTDLLRRGDRVRHETRTDWGLGEVLDDQAAGSLKVKVIFEDVGVKTFDLRFAQMRRVFGEEAQSDYLSSLVKQASKSGGKAKRAASSPACSFARGIEVFLHAFPRGVQDPQYFEEEREYKVAAHRLTLELLGRDELNRLVPAGNYAEICGRARQIINKTNLIHHYEKIWLSDALSSEGRRQVFAKELWNLLYGEDALQRRFESHVKMLYDIGAAKWTLATYFLFLAHPEEQMFVKPEVTKRAAKMMCVDIDYRPEVNWSTYSRVLQLAEAIRQKLSGEGKEELLVRDMIDVQSFMWVTGYNYSA